MEVWEIKMEKLCRLSSLGPGLYSHPCKQIMYKPTMCHNLYQRLSRLNLSRLLSLSSLNHNRFLFRHNLSLILWFRPLPRLLQPQIPNPKVLFQQPKPPKNKKPRKP